MRPVKVLITGGAGFIGSTIASACLDRGVIPVILDNLATGCVEFATDRAFYEGDVTDGHVVDRIFRDHSDIETVIHCAALSVVPDSVAQPLRYYQENVGKGIEFTGHLLRNGCHRLIFSSSACVYGVGGSFTVDENSPIDPRSPYACSKSMMEKVMDDIAAVTPLRVLSLRYFNPIGADPKMRTGLPGGRTNSVLGAMISASSDGTPFRITGTDYPTRDGTAIRDYVHVWDLAQAHVNAVRRFPHLFTNGNHRLVVNLGTGKGTTVRELVDVFNEVARCHLHVVEANRRPGDLPGFYSRYERARQLLGWRPALSIADSVRDSLEWAYRSQSVFEQ